MLLSLQNPLRNTFDTDDRLSESDRNLLHSFRANLNEFSNVLCLVCKERFPSTELRNVCRRCCKDKNDVKKFSAANNMDPGDIPDDFKDLTEIEEMLIAQFFLLSRYTVFAVVSMLTVVMQQDSLVNHHPSMFLLCVVSHQMVWRLKILMLDALKSLALLTG
jgi:hypothetical protein